MKESSKMSTYFLSPLTKISFKKFVLKSKSSTPLSHRSKQIELQSSTIHIVSELAKTEEYVKLIVDSGVVAALVRHLQAPPPPPNDGGPIPYEHEVEKGSAFTLGLLAIKPEHQQLIVDTGALPHLVNLLKRHKGGENSRAINGVTRRAADAITNLAHEVAALKTVSGPKVVSLPLLNCSSLLT